MHTVINDEFYMKLAIELAERVIGQTGINPAVGCVIVNDGQIVGMGAHLRRGEGHAEVHALQMAGSRAEGGTAYVTLEPCSHFGKTPPCSLRLMEAGVKRVVVACTDPNPVVAGSGLTLLRQQAIEVKVGVLALEAYRIIEKFAKYITTGLPYVTLKTAQTLDGKIATHEGHSQWITNEQAREVVHTLRHRHQAIMVGIGTVLQDDPSLTTRLSVQGLNPIRMIVDSKLRLPLSAKVVSDKSAQTWVLTTITADQDRAAALERNGVTVIRINEGDRVDVRKAIEACGQREISSILLEGGGHLNGSMLEAGLIDQVVLMIAPKIVGHKDAPGSFIFPGPAKMSDAYCLEQISVETLGDNVIISGLPVRQEQEGREE
ncbi:bifunctional diaminohydroxyphosphoribosylaminopyrimidine deaminase/5-amino-6-(5-phosphoribosylamino)uracil reductase RibD [Paenibacillus sp. ACRRX]|uniref:bifunctional diaminohydroxyphosphoribosylaminopyrimidine deaminase/5-amino-6-(5-phosphoribosylamino)uracil reductase RibD n=1 Tax=Paenibacillus sp. ACRRX TaxID=2918206 RepID=UPI001EF6C345|nr:bifunctional diaminohydroxyphosphoribosylaminopyrimidine deaminase/5-amino-6-(5-phosphoribosylamino)uracil reductase RibD [Paenibacillus sp. ACRRX]MCG7406395.1 bifunctional diaminohydroxyphosphoribosylaminopyrimidine deaminase/5-amino-6-(5-phosphoribosylamino)uracil reductase RibD [Paenibacillus sp. ACRRX]